MIQNNNFDELVSSYKMLPLQEKKTIAHEEIKKTLAFIEKAKTDLNINKEILLNREILDLNSNNISDEDFVEAVFVYIHAIQESLGDYFEVVSKYLYK